MKRILLIGIVLANVSSFHVASASNFLQHDQEALDRIYEADRQNVLYTVNAGEALRVLHAHVKFLEGKKSNYRGLFGGPMVTGASTLFGGYLGLQGLLNGLGAVYYASLFNRIAGWAEKNSGWLSNRFTAFVGALTGQISDLPIKKGEEEILRALTEEKITFADAVIIPALMAPVFGLASVKLLSYAWSKRDAVQRDKWLDSQIAKDNVIIEKLIRLLPVNQ